MSKNTNLVENKELREELIGRVEVLDRVGNLLLLDELEMATTEMVASYYGEDVSTIKMCVKNNRDEIESDGYKVWKKNDFNESKINLLSSTKTNFTISLGNEEVVVSNRGVALFPKRSILRIGMLLRDSKVAKEIRTQLLNVVEVVKENNDEMLVQEFDKGCVEINGKNVEYLKVGDCWHCLNYKPISKEGYYRMRINGHKKLIHRLMYRKFNGEIEDGLIVRHKCDNPLCINPSHLEVGTYLDNFNDMVERKRNKIARKGFVSKPTKEICCINAYYEVENYSNAKFSGYDNSAVLKVCKSKSYFAYGKMFMFCEDYKDFDLYLFLKNHEVKGICKKRGKYEVSYNSKYIGRYENKHEAIIVRLKYELDSFGVEKAPQAMFFKFYGLI